MNAGPPSPPRAPVIRGRDVALSIGFAILLFLVGSLAAGLILPRDTTNGVHRQFAVLVQLAVMAFAQLGALYLAPIRHGGLHWADLGLVACDRRWIRRALLIAVALIPAAMLFGYLVRQLEPTTGGAKLIDMIAPAGFSWLIAATTLLYAGILTPVVEELFFRGLLYGWLRRHLGVAGAALLAAVVFALLHQRLDAVIVAFFSALILTWLYEKSGSLLPSIVLHQAVNTAQLVLVYVAVGLTPSPTG